jgi:hypothetical protein
MRSPIVEQEEDNSIESSDINRLDKELQISTLSSTNPLEQQETLASSVGETTLTTHEQEQEIVHD